MQVGKNIIKLISRIVASLSVIIILYLIYICYIFFSAFNHGKVKDVVIKDYMYQLNHNNEEYYILYCPKVCLRDNGSVFIKSKREISNIYSENENTLVIIVPNNISNGKISHLNIFNMPVEKIEKLPNLTRYHYGFVPNYDINVAVEYKNL